MDQIENTAEETTLETAAPDVVEIPAAPEVTDEKPPQRRRGRPRKNPELTTESVGASSGGSAGRRPGRTSKAQQDKITDLAHQLVGVHTIVAMVTGIPEMAIQPQEAESLARGITAVCDEYGLSVDGKTGAALQLVAAAAMVYGPRAYAIYARGKATEKARAQAAPEQTAPQGGEVIDYAQFTAAHAAPVGG